MELIEILWEWAGRNPVLPVVLLGPIVIAIGVVLATARTAAKFPAQTPAPAPAPELEVLAPAASSVEPTPEVSQAPLPFPDPVAAVPPKLEPESPREPEPASDPEPEPEVLEVPEPAPVRLRDRLRLTSESLAGKLGELLGGRTVDADLLDELEMLLFQADLGVKTADSLLAEVRSKAAGGDGDAVRGVLRTAILEKLQRVEGDRTLALNPSEASPHVILVLGVNGAGKTTSIGKLAARYRAAGHSVLLGAGDTFRAAASEQLQVWGERAGCDVIAGHAGGDPSAVAFDTVKAANARGVDVAIIDTAGRLQTKAPLMEELGKMVRVINKGLEGAPHEVLLVLDATTGQNAISQANLFTEVAGVTGLILTKLDGTAKGGVLIGLADEFGIPVKFVGIGEAVGDLRDFDAKEFVDAVFTA
jgi:fused signal recognition particle receptor